MHVCMHVYIWGMSRSIQPCNMKNRDIYWIKYKVQEIWYIGQWCLCPLQSRHLGSSHSFPTCHQLPCHIFLNLTNSLKFLPFQRVFCVCVCGKARSCRVSNLGCMGAESPGWFDVSPKTSAGDVMHERAHCHDEAANHQLPIAAAFWIIWIVPVEECSSLTQNLMQISCSTCSVI